MLIEWKEAYLTGIDEFDDHHRKLFDLLNKSYFMIVEGSSQEELGELLAELLDYVRYHFAAEEELMRAKAYRKIDEHLIEHFNFTHRVQSFEKEARDDQQYLPVEIFDFIRHWFLDHIVTVDVEMSRALRFK